MMSIAAHIAGTQREAARKIVAAVILIASDVALVRLVGGCDDCFGLVVTAGRRLLPNV